MAKPKQRSKRPLKRKRMPVYLFIVEGCTEKNYINCLKQLYRKNGEIKNSQGGSAKAVMQLAEKQIALFQNEYTGFVVWFDADTYNERKDKEQLARLQSDDNVTVLMSKPCIENWLLAHFESPKSKNSHCKHCERRLRTYIPSYKKGDCRLIERYIDKSHVERAIQNDPIIGLIPKTYFIP